MGRRIVEKAEYVHIFGESFPLRAEVYTLFGYSAHADRLDLLDWLKPHAETVKTAFVVHGEPKSAQALAEGMRELGYRNIMAPQRKDKIVV